MRFQFRGNVLYATVIPTEEAGIICTLGVWLLRRKMKRDALGRGKRDLLFLVGVLRKHATCNMLSFRWLLFRYTQPKATNMTDSGLPSHGTTYKVAWEWTGCWRESTRGADVVRHRYACVLCQMGARVVREKHSNTHPDAGDGC